MWYAIGIVVVLAVAFLWWRITSVARGARQREAKIMRALTPVGEKLSRGSEVTPAEVARLCERYELRPVLYAILDQFGRLDLYPDSLKSWECQAEGLLAFWMMHPNEYRDPPTQMECVQREERDLGGRKATFLVLRFRMPEGHWSGHDTWHLGVSGPFFENGAPFAGPASAFSRCGDTLETVQPGELVDWFVNLVRQKGG